MTDEEFEAMWRRAKARDAEEEAKFAALPKEEQKRRAKEAEEARCWEDLTDIESAESL